MIESLEIAGKFVAKEAKGSFDEYLLKRGAMSDFIRLNLSEKEKVFLKWKWGFESDNSNRDLQGTRNMLYGDETDETISQIKDEYEKGYVRLTVNWERKCKMMAEKYGIGHLIYVSFAGCKQSDSYAKEFGGKIVGARRL